MLGRDKRDHPLCCSFWLVFEGIVKILGDTACDSNMIGFQLMSLDGSMVGIVLHILFGQVLGLLDRRLTSHSQKMRRGIKVTKGDGKV